MWRGKILGGIKNSIYVINASAIYGKDARLSVFSYIYKRDLNGRE